MSKTMTDMISFAVGVAGTLASGVGIVVSIYLYRLAKRETSRAEVSIDETLRITRVSADDTMFQVAQKSFDLLKNTEVALERTSTELADVLEMHAIELASVTSEDFILRLIERSNRNNTVVTVGTVRDATRKSRWTQVGTLSALRTLADQGRIRFDGDPSRDETVIRPAL